MSKFNKQFNASRRAHRTRAKLSGSSKRPRVSVFTSLQGMFVQLIDDSAGKTLLSIRTKKSKATKIEQAAALGKALAEQAKAKGITEVVFDRGSKLYHGRVKALAESLREGGLKF